MDSLKFPAAQASDLETNRVGTDIDSGEDGHIPRAVDYELCVHLAHSLIS
jgi:hypothetical protein